MKTVNQNIKFEMFDNIIKFVTKKEFYGLILILIGIYIINKLFNKIMDKIVFASKTELDKKRRRTAVELLKNIKKYAIIVIGVLFALNFYGVNVTSVTASLGIASAVSALALQDSLRDIMSGIAIIFDNYFIVGDYVKYKNFTGTVTQFGLRSTKIMNFDGEVYVIANRNISEIVNLSQQTASSLVEIPTAYEEKIEKVEKILEEVVKEIKEWPTMNNDKTSYIGITELANSSIKYGIRYYCSPGKVWQYKRDILRLVKQKYDKHKIKIPYEQIEVHNAK